MNSEQEYVKLLDLLVRVLEANKRPLKGAEARLLSAEELAVKFSFHAASVLHLSHGTQLELPNFPSDQFKFIDPASINVLARAALETFLVFHHIFIAPNTPKEKNCRYLAWKAAGLTERQSFPVSVEEHRQRLAERKKEIDELHSKLKSNSVFQQLPKNQQKQLLKGKWKLPSWPDIAKSAGSAKDLSTNEGIYSYLCEYAHSGSLSTIQLKQAGMDKELSFLIQFVMMYIPIVTANFIRAYCHLFPKAKAALNADVEGRKMVKGLIKVGQELSFGDNKL